MSWLWLIPTAVIAAMIGFAAGRTIGESNTVWELEDHSQLSMAIGFLIATRQLQTVEAVQVFIYQILIDARAQQMKG